MISNWDRKFISIARLTASWSKDPRTKVGCIIVDDDHNQLSGGFNGFPRGVADDGRLEDRETKLKIVVHAEANAVATAARNGHSLKGSTAYITLPPCCQCASLLIQAGVKKVVFPHRFLTDDSHPGWSDSFKSAEDLLIEAGVQCAWYDGAEL